VFFNKYVYLYDTYYKNSYPRQKYLTGIMRSYDARLSNTRRVTVDDSSDAYSSGSERLRVLLWNRL